MSALIAKRNFERDMRAFSVTWIECRSNSVLDLGAFMSLRMPDFTLTGQLPVTTESTRTAIIALPSTVATSVANL